MKSMMDMHNKIHTLVDHKFRHALLPSKTEPKEFSVQALRGQVRCPCSCHKAQHGHLFYSSATIAKSLWN